MILTIVLGYSIGHYLGLDWKELLWLGALISTSNTMITLKLLKNKGVVIPAGQSQKNV